MGSDDSSSRGRSRGSVPANPLVAIERVRRAVEALDDGTELAETLRRALQNKAKGGRAGAGAAPVAAEWAALLEAGGLSAVEDQLVAGRAAAEETLREVERDRRARRP